MLVIPIFGRQRQDDCYKFETSLGYIVSSRLAPGSELQLSSSKRSQSHPYNTQDPIFSQNMGEGP